MGLTVLSLWQSPVRSATVGNLLRMNSALIFYMESTVVAMSATDWVSVDMSKKQFVQMVKGVVQKRTHTAGVILIYSGVKYRRTVAPANFVITKIGGPSMRGKLLDLPPQPKVSQLLAQLHALIPAPRALLNNHLCFSSILAGRSEAEAEGI